MALSNDVVEWLRGERVPVTRGEFLTEITRMAACKLWPEASHEEWCTALDEAIKAGAVVESNGKVAIALTSVAGVEQTKQQRLFDA